MRIFRHIHHHSERYAVGIAAAVITLTLVCAGIFQAKRWAKAKVATIIAQIDRKLNVPIEIGSWHIGLGKAYFDDLVIGHDTSVIISRMTAEVGFNPFTDDFGKLALVTIDRVRIKSNLNRLRDTAYALDSLALVEDSQSENIRRSIDKLFAVLPTQKLWIKSANVIVTDALNQSLIGVRGFTLLVDKAQKKVLFKVGNIRSKSGLFDRHLHGRLEIRPGSDSYRFLVRRKPPAAAQPAPWTISGEVNKSLTAFELAIDADQMPDFLKQHLQQKQLIQQPRLNLSGLIKAWRDNAQWQYDAKFTSDQTVLHVPLISPEAIGPITFDVLARGSFNTNRNALTIDQAVITLPTRIAREKVASRSVQVELSGMGHLLTEEDTHQVSWQGQLRLPDTPCQYLLDAAPPGLVPALEDFRLSGHVTAGVNFAFDSQNPNNVVFDLNASQFDCKVSSAPLTYSGEYLNGPFTLKRQVVKNERPFELTLSPNSPNFTPLKALNHYVNLAFITSEDASFYHHKGIDKQALASALRRNIAEGRVLVGGSTITMQTVKNLFLTHDRNISRKMQEIFLSWHLENTLSKDRILELYINIIEFGPSIYGITQAAQHFFGKAPQDLSLLESAYLASLLPSPRTRYNQFCAGNLTPEYKDMVHGLLRRMLNLGRITSSRYQQAVAMNLKFNQKARLSSNECTRQLSLGSIDATYNR